MTPRIIAKGVKASGTLREYVTERLNDVLRHTQNSIDYITVRLTDLNGPKGGVDKRCLIHIKLLELSPIIVTEIASDINSAIDIAAHRVSRIVSRALSRAKKVSHATMPLYIKKSYLAV